MVSPFNHPPPFCLPCPGLDTRPLTIWALDTVMTLFRF